MSDTEHNGLFNQSQSGSLAPGQERGLCAGLLDRQGADTAVADTAEPVQPAEIPVKEKVAH
ncbi:hypothetical protein QP986_03655 [Corynebacterium striatum]|nr:hypothetical protein [Corynebacterium striatum]